MQHFFRQLAWTFGVSIVMIALFAGLGIAMEPKWSVKPLSMHLQVTERSTAIKARGITTPQEGTYQVRQTRLRLPISGGKTVNAILREPENAPSGRAACVFVHGAGTGKAEEVYADLANALASAGITTLVQDKRLDNYTPLRRDYDSSAEDYLAGLNLLRAQQGVDARKVGLYAESEGTWIASVMTHKDRHIAVQVLTSAPVYSGRQQIAMAATEYLNIIGAPGGVVDIIPRLLSLNFAPIGLEYADFNTAEYRDTLTMPLLVNYGTIDPAMPIEQGALQLIGDAHAAGNSNVLVRYYAANHQMRTGSSLSLPGLPLDKDYTHNLEDWINAIAAGATEDDWLTPDIAGARPYQEYAIPENISSGLVSSVWVLVVLIVICLVSWLLTVVFCIGAFVSRKRVEAKTVDDSGHIVVHRFTMLSKVLIITNIVLLPICAAGFLGYFAFTAKAALSLTDEATMLSFGWSMLRLGSLVLIVMNSWMWVRMFFFYGPGNIDKEYPKTAMRMASGHTATVALLSVSVLCALVLSSFFGLIG